MRYKIKVPEINSKVTLDRGETGKIVKYKSLGWGLPYYVIEYNDLSRNTQRWYDIDKFYSVVDLEIDVYDLDTLVFYELQTVKVKAYKWDISKEYKKETLLTLVDYDDGSHRDWIPFDELRPYDKNMEEVYAEVKMSQQKKAMENRI